MLRQFRALSWAMFACGAVVASQVVADDHRSVQPKFQFGKSGSAPLVASRSTPATSGKSGGNYWANVASYQADESYEGPSAGGCEGGDCDNSGGGGGGCAGGQCAAGGAAAGAIAAAIHAYPNYGLSHPYPCNYRDYGPPDLFKQYYAGNNCDGHGAELYIAPRPVPPHVGHTFYTYQPFYPHEMMYPHGRKYYRYYDQGRGYNRTAVRWTR